MNKARLIPVFLLIAVILWLVGCGTSTKPEWSRTFGGDDRDEALSVQQTSDGGYIIAGYSRSYGAGDEDFYIIKTDLRGKEEWSRTFGGEYNDRAYSVEQTSDGGYIVAGYTFSFGARSDNLYLIKTDSEGKEEWSRTFGGDNREAAFSVEQTSDGGYIVAGYSRSYSAGDEDFYILKTDSEGNEEWSKTFGGEYNDRAYSVEQTSDGGYIVAGYTYSYGAGSDDLYIIKTDLRGNEEWSRTFGGAYNDRAYSVEQTSDGGYIIAGYSILQIASVRDFYILKTDSEGNEEWSKAFGGAQRDEAFSVEQTSDGGYIAAGYTKSYGAGSEDFYIIKTDLRGNKEWSRTFGGASNDIAFSVKQTSDGGYITAGHTASRGAGSEDCYIIKISAPGTAE